MDIEFGFAQKKLIIDIPDSKLISVLKPNNVPVSLNEADVVKKSLDEPIGTEKLSKLVKPGNKVVIITSDITRPFPSYKVIPLVLNELYAGGVSKKDITIVFALGSHRCHTEQEMRMLVSDEVYDNIQCIDTSADRCIHLGTTSRGTPVDIFDTVAKADVRVCLGNIEYHYFAGYSGGAKAIMPGASTRAAIQSNHSLMVEDGAVTGQLDTNPLRNDIEEAIKYCHIDFIVNVVLNEKKEIITCVSGHFIHAHRVGCAFLDKIYKVSIPRKAEIVVVSAGGFPKDINMYQAQKALDNAKHAVKDGGIIIWIASCKDGLGEDVFEKWMKEHESSDDMIDHIRQDFQLGGHKAAAIAMVLRRARIFLVSDLEEDFVRSIHLIHYSDALKGLDEAIRLLGKDAKIIAMPYGGSTLPILEE